MDRLLEQEIEIQRKKEVLRQTIKLLEPLYGRDAELEASGISLAEALAQDELGITDAVEHVLMARAGQILSPTKVRDLLTEGGYVIRGDNPMATIHTVLKRLAAKGNGPIDAIEDQAGKTGYMAVMRSNPQPMRGPLAAAAQRLGKELAERSEKK